MVFSNVVFSNLVSNKPAAWPLVLASGSPRRAELLQLLGRPFQVVLPQVPEQRAPSESAAAYVQRLAISKAEAGAALWRTKATANTTTNSLVLGSDTVVVVDYAQAHEQVLEKPRDFADFQRMMQLLSGTTHTVLTAVAVTQSAQLEPTTDVTMATMVATEVSFKPLSEGEIAAYWASGEPQDKAGGYGIQGLAGRFVTHLQGSYFAVVGLPLYETAELLTRVETQQAGGQQ